jgi:hypothetical protein
MTFLIYHYWPHMISVVDNVNELIMEEEIMTVKIVTGKAYNCPALKPISGK